jgi:PiT family inorganic phosphate transporter
MNHPLLIEIAVLSVVALTALFSFTNGFKDASAIVATVVSTRVLSPEVALALVAVFEFLGASLLGTAVARTVGGRVIHWAALPVGPRGLVVVAGALFGALSWNAVSWYRALPTSSGQALLGGLLGAGWAGWGAQSIAWNTASLILLSLILTPALGFCASAALTRLLNFASAGLSPRWNEFYKWLQIPSCVAMSLAYGTNDAQGAMGVITLGLFVGGAHVPAGGLFQVPQWVVTLCAFSISLGVLVGGSRILKTLGMKLYRISPLQGFSAQASSGGAIFLAALAGFPASTTQAITSSILGAGASLRPKSVRWELAQEVVLAWLVTVPVAALLGAAGFWILELSYKMLRVYH